MSPLSFTQKAIKVLRTPGYKGLHTVYSGYNAAFRIEYPKLDPITFIKECMEKQQIFCHATRGGAMIYLWEDKPETQGNESKAQSGTTARLPSDVGEGTQTVIL